MPENCSVQERKGSKVKTHTGACKGLELALVFQEDSFEALTKPLENVDKNPPACLKNPDFKRMQVNKLPDGSEMHILTSKAKDKNGVGRISVWR